MLLRWALLAVGVWPQATAALSGETLVWIESLKLPLLFPVHSKANQELW
jgi:hypothetical protein